MGGNALAAEGFKVRYQMTGALGSELATFVPLEMWFAGMQLNHTQLRQLNDASGNQASTPVAVGSNGVRQSAILNYGQVNRVALLSMGQVTPADYAGGRLAWNVTVPWAIDDRRQLSYTPSAYDAAGNSVAPSPAFVNALAANAQANSLSGSGLGDVDVTVSWIRNIEHWRWGVGLGIGLPTGNYSTSSSTPHLNIGAGRFYTLRPTFTAAHQVSEDLSIGARLTLGLNTTNTANRWRSGNFGAIELSAPWRMSIGVISPTLVHVRQVQDDSGGQSGSCVGCLGANRMSLTSTGVTFLTRIEGWGVSLGYSGIVQANNGFLSSTLLLRAGKAF